jgi:hypothetical protein
VGKGSGPESTVSHGTSRLVKIIVVLQTLVILFLGYWAVEEYQNNIYFQSYVNATVQANMLTLVGVFVGVPVISILGLMLRRGRGRSRGEKLVDVEEAVQPSRGSFGVASSSDVGQGGSSGMSSLAAELSSRFLGQVAVAPSQPSGQIMNRGGVPILQRSDQATTAKPRPVEPGLPVLEKVEPRRVESKSDVPRYEPPRFATGPAPASNSGYRPSPPNFPRPPDNPGMRRPPVSAPLVRPPTVVTGIMGQGPRPFNPPSSQPQGSNRQGQGPPSQRFDEKWEPGVRPPAPLGVQPKPQQFGSSGSSGTGASLPGTPIGPALLGRIGPVRSAADKTPGAEFSPGLNRVEPAQSSASPPSWPKTVQASSMGAGSPSPGLEEGSKTDDSLSSLLAGDKQGQPAKRDEKRQDPGENSGS